jgi:aminoglycoside 3-N-acetyltransferase
MSLNLDLKNFWLNCGIRKGENLLLHTDIRRTYFYFKKHYKNFKIDYLFESLLDIILPDGSIAFPTFNFAFNKGLTFDYLHTPSKMGSLTEFARLSKFSYRTLNPVYSFSVIGKLQNKFIGIDNLSWYSRESPFHLFKELNFKIFILDLDDNDSMTFLHYCEEYFQVQYRYYKNFSGYYVGADGFKKHRTYKGFVRKINEGIITNCNPASEILWEKNKYKGNKPFTNNGMRYIYANDYFNFFKKNYDLNTLENIFYDKK